MLFERRVLLRPEANELRTAFAYHIQKDARTEQVQPRAQGVAHTMNRILQTREQKQYHTQRDKDENDKRIQRDQ